MRVSIDAGLLQMVVNALKRDASEGKVIRGEMVAEIEKDAQPLPAAKPKYERYTPAYQISWAMAGHQYHSAIHVDRNLPHSVLVMPDGTTLNAAKYTQGGLYV